MDPESDAPPARAATSAALARAAALSRGAGEAMGGGRWWAKMLALMFATATCSCAAKRKAAPKQLSSAESIAAAKAAGQQEGVEYVVRKQNLTSTKAIAAAKAAGKHEGVDFCVCLPIFKEGSKRAIAAALAGVAYGVASEARLLSCSTRSNAAKLEREAARLTFEKDNRSADEQELKVNAIADFVIAWLRMMYLEYPNGTSYQQVGRARRMQLIQGPVGPRPPTFSKSELASWFTRPNSGVRVVRPGDALASKPGARELNVLYDAGLLLFYSGMLNPEPDVETDKHGHIVNRAEVKIQQAVKAMYPLASENNVVKVIGAGGCGLSAPGKDPAYLEENAAGAWFLRREAFEEGNASGIRLVWVDSELIKDTATAYRLLLETLESRDMNVDPSGEASDFSKMVPPMMSEEWDSIPSEVNMLATTPNGGTKGYISVVTGTRVARFWASKGPHGLKAWQCMASDYRPFGPKKGAVLAWKEHGRVVRSKMKLTKRGGVYGEAENAETLVNYFAESSNAAETMSAFMGAAAQAATTS